MIKSRRSWARDQTRRQFKILGLERGTYEGDLIYGLMNKLNAYRYDKAIRKQLSSVTVSINGQAVCERDLTLRQQRSVIRRGRAKAYTINRETRERDLRLLAAREANQQTIGKFARDAVWPIGHKRAS